MNHHFEGEILITILLTKALESQTSCYWLSLSEHQTHLQTDYLKINGSQNYMPSGDIMLTYIHDTW